MLLIAGKTSYAVRPIRGHVQKNPTTYAANLRPPSLAEGCVTMWPADNDQKAAGAISKGEVEIRASCVVWLCAFAEVIVSHSAHLHLVATTASADD